MRLISILVSMVLVACLQAEVVISMPPPPPNAAPAAIATAAVAALSGFAANTPAKDRAGGVLSHPDVRGEQDDTTILVARGGSYDDGYGGYGYGGYGYGYGGYGYGGWGWWPPVFWGYGCLPVYCSGNGIGTIAGSSSWSSGTCGSRFTSISIGF